MIFLNRLFSQEFDELLNVAKAATPIAPQNLWETTTTTNSGLSLNIESSEKDGVGFINIDVPGVKKEDIDLTIIDNDLRLVLKRKEKTHTHKLVINKKYDASTTTAKVENGVMTLTIQPSQIKKSKGTKINIL